MRTALITFAAAASALAVAAPAAAQYYPAPPPPAYGSPYGAPYGNAWGYQNSYGQVRALQARIDRLQRQIVQLDRRNAISRSEAYRLNNTARAIEHRLVHATRYGLRPDERYDIERRIVQLEQRIWRVARNGRGWNRDYGYNDGRWDREHDRWHDRNDRRGHDHDDDDD